MIKMIQAVAFVLILFACFSPDCLAQNEIDPHLVSSYQRGNYKSVIEILKEKPNRNAQEALYLGLSYLRKGDQAKAIESWKEYVELLPGSEGTRNISQYLTQLVREEAKREALVIRQSEKTIGTRIDPTAVAVSPFRNLGQETYNPLSKGLAEMIITDLSQVKSLKVLERIHIQALFDELKLSQSSLIDQQSAPQLGKLLGAGKIASGSFLDLDKEQFRLDAVVAGTEDGKLLTSPEASGKFSAFYEVEKSLVFNILCGLGICPESLDSRTRQALEIVHTKNFKAFRYYSEGLDFLDHGKYREASQSFFRAVEEDPAFNLARKALLATPTAPMDMNAMISGGESVAQNQTLVQNLGAYSIAFKVPVKGSQAILNPPIMQQPATSTGAGAPSTGSAIITITAPKP